ncbi:hypothetical protein [Oceanobacillus alkalisoli]|uniref:hypothetical protein n=1 Tax=Oceanobacillus alkalisoli TaxID=2925113 RepID=UPI001F11E382|nr:hypothetical protein [Oceanobacillus alkalisoli]MCF3942232.1 hypothetical protein [Oceanobacillus alkalisoli]
MKGLFIKSMQHKEKIVIFYMDSSGEVTQRYVRVLKMNDSHILVYCYYRKKVRTLKLDNILSCGSIRKGIA